MEESRAPTFTEILYGVVVGFGITELEFPWFTRHNVLLLLAIVLIFDDYLLYTTAVRRVAHSERNGILLSLFDMLVIVAWYAIALAVDEDLPTYFVCIAVFYALASVWEIIFSAGPLWRRALVAADVPLAAMAIGLAIVFSRLAGPEWPYVLGFFSGFALSRFQDYASLWRS